MIKGLGVILNDFQLPQILRKGSPCHVKEGNKGISGSLMIDFMVGGNCTTKVKGALHTAAMFCATPGAPLCK